MNQTQTTTYYDDDVISLSEIFAILHRGKWWIAGSTLLFALSALVYLMLATPIYRAKTLLQLQSGQAQSAIEIIKSTAIIGSVVKSEKLDIIAQPEYLPIIGKALACRTGADNCSKRDALKVEVFDAPARLQNQPLTLVAGENGRYELRHGQQLVLAGQKNELSKNTLADGEIKLQLTEFNASPGTKYELKKESLIEATEGLLERMTASEQGKGTNIIAITITGANPQKNEKIANQLVSVYEQYDMQQQLEQINEQFPPKEDAARKAKKALDNAQSDLTKFQAANSTIPLAELSILNEIELKQESLTKPINEALSGDINMLMGMQLVREVESANRRYVNLKNQLADLETAKSSITSNIEILSKALSTTDPIKPKKPLIFVLAVILGGMVGLGVVFIRHMFNPELNIEKLKQLSGLPVLAVVPQSEQQRNINKSKSGPGRLLADIAPTDATIESLRALRTNLLFELSKAENNRIMLTSPKKGAGKSFVTANLGALIAAAGSKTLVISADLREDNLNTTFGINAEQGLADVLMNTGIKAIQRVNDNLYLLAGGHKPSNPSELLMAPGFRDLLDSVSGQYDVVIVDAPPALAVTDAAIVGKACAITVMVSSGRGSVEDVRAAVDTLQRAGVVVGGATING